MSATPSFLSRLIGSISRTATGRSRESEKEARRVAGLCTALVSAQGEVSGARLALEALAAYLALDAQAAAALFDLLAEEFSPDPAVIAKHADAYRKMPSQANLVALQRAVASPRQELFKRLNPAPGGTAVLVEMRQRILHEIARKPGWLGIEADLASLFGSWFNRGFLTLQRIDWRTSAIVLEKLIQYEAVHRIVDWRDLRRRLQADRRCYAFFHPALPDEPLIFIEVALTKGMSESVQPLLDPDSPVADPEAADCATFYSITNCQQGLRGISFGNLLIKQVAEDLGREFPKLDTFATLSPVPGFRPWLERLSDTVSGAGRDELRGMLKQLAAAGTPPDRKSLAPFQKELQRLCAFYLLQAKRGSDPLDPVARFHLGNGARLERMNWLADVSDSGMKRSAGLMVNYTYKLAEVERNHEAYAKEHRVVASRRFEVQARESIAARAVEPGRLSGATEAGRSPGAAETGRSPGAAARQ